MQLRLSKRILFYVFFIVFLSSLNNKYFLTSELEPINKIEIIGLEEAEIQDLLNNFESNPSANRIKGLDIVMIP